MSGHSKWSTIKHKKGAADKKRADIFGKLARAITVAARQGGGDIEMNYALRSATEKAKAENMPKDNIERAIKRGTGELEGGGQIEELLLEAYGPGGTALLIEAVTDNKNRTTGEVRAIITKHNGKPAGEGSVKWLFERKISVSIPTGAIQDRDAFELTAIDAGAEDIVWDEEYATLYIKPETLQEILKTLEETGYSDIKTSLDWIAKDEIEIPEQDAQKLERLFEALNEQDDVQEIYTNAK